MCSFTLRIQITIFSLREHDCTIFEIKLNIFFRTFESDRVNFFNMIKEEYNSSAVLETIACLGSSRISHTKLEWWL